MATALHIERNCTGCPTRQRGAVVVLDGVPKPVQPPGRPAYPDGWADVAREVSAELGYDLADAISHDPDAFDPIPHCLRLTWADPIVAAWLRAWSLIDAGHKRAPEWTHPAYESIAIGIRVIRDGITAARSRAAAQTRSADG